MEQTAAPGTPAPVPDDASVPQEPGPPPWLHGGDLVARQLAAEGVRHLFTLTGGHISPLYDGTRFTGTRLVDFRHEQAAVHAADAYARATRAPAAAALTAGPGVTGGITGVANAFYAHSPVVVLGGRNPFMTDGAGNLQEAPHIELMRPVTKYCQAVHDVWRTRDIVREAFAAATAPRSGPTYVDLPIDVQLTRFEAAHAPPPRTPTAPAPAEPSPDAVKRVAGLLAQAERPVLFAGSGAYWSRAEHALDAVARAAAAPVFLNGMARGLLGRSHPRQLSAVRKTALAEADLLIMLGADFDFRVGFGQPGVLAEDAVVVQVDPQASRIGRNRDVSLAVVSDIGRFLEALACLDAVFGRTRPGAWTERLHGLEANALARRRHAVEGNEAPIHPQRLAQELADFFDEDAVVIGDGGDVVTMASGAVRPGGPGCWMDPGPFGCLGVGAPFAMGARLARPGKQVAVVFGDGAFGFNGFEYDSAVRQKLPFVGIMGNDGAWGEMRTFHEDVFGPDYVAAQYLSQSTAYEKIVEGMGGHGERVERASRIRPALERAFAAGVPALVNVLLDTSYRHKANTISGRHLATAYGGGDAHAFRRP